jgi:predicted DNA-binding ribbon-helix-helix protein
MHGKRGQFDDEMSLALDVLARDRMMTVQELADEAFDDLLKKHHRPANLKSALKQSARLEAGASGPDSGIRRRRPIKDA